MKHEVSPSATQGANPVAVNILRTLGRQLFAVLLGLGFSVLIGRTLGPEGTGLYAVAYLLPTFLSAMLNLGIPAANVYYVGRRDFSLGAVLRSDAWLWLATSLLGLLIAIPILVRSADLLFPNVSMDMLWIALLAFPVSLLLSFLSSLLQAKQDFRAFNVVLLLQPLIAIGLASAFIWVFGLGVVGALLAQLLAAVAATVAATLAIRRHLLTDSASSYSVPYAPKALGFGLRVHSSNVLTFINYRADIFIVNLLLSPALAGIYVVAVQVAERAWVLSQAVSTVIYPRLAELHARGELKTQLTLRVARWTLFLSCGAALGLALIGRPLIILLFGPTFAGAYTALLWLLPGIALSGLARVLAHDIAARGKPELNSYISLAVVITNISGNLLLVPHFGIVGAAASSTLAYILQTFLTVWLYARLGTVAWWSVVMLALEDWEQAKELAFRHRRQTAENTESENTESISDTPNSGGDDTS